MIDATVAFAPARDVAVLDLWDGDPPPVVGRMVRVEPRRWWLLDAGDDRDAVAAAVAGRGALTPIGGGLIRATITGPAWRDLLSVSGLFDTGEGGFPIGAHAGTVIHHVPVHIVAVDRAICEAYVATSYAPTLEELWRKACLGG